MKVLLAIESAGAGSGRHVMDLANGLVRRGHEVSLVYSRSRTDRMFEDFLAVADGISLYPLDWQRSMSLRDIGHAVELRRLIRTIGPFDVLHAHSSKAGALLRMAAAGSGVPCIYTPHALVTLDRELGAMARTVYGTAERLLSKFAARIVCVSEHERRHAKDLGLGSDRLRVIENGLNVLAPVDRESVRKDLGLNSDELCIGTVGRLTHQKGVERLLAAFAKMQPRVDSARLVIVGDGPDEGEIKKQCHALGIEQQVSLHGVGDGPRLMAGFDIYAMTSRYEACPYVLLEANSRGLPIVMMDTGGAGSLVVNGRNGYVVDQTDTTAFSERLRDLATDLGLRQRMGAQSRRIAAESTVDRMVDDTLAVYLEVCR